MTTLAAEAEFARGHEEGLSQLRLGVLSTHPIQYFSPLYRRLADRTAALQVGYFRRLDGAERAPEIEDPGFARAIRWDGDLLDGYDWRSFGLADAPFRYRAGDLWRLALAVAHWCRSFGPDVALVPGWTWPYLIAARVLHARGVAVVLRPEAREPRGGNPVRALLRDRAVKRTTAVADAVAVIGSAAREELLRLAVPEGRLVWSPHVIDTDHWSRGAALGAGRRTELRRRYGFGPQNVVYLSVGKLIGYKRPDVLLEAFAALAARLPVVRLLMVGDGPLRETLEVRARAPDLAGRVTFAGFVNQSALPACYAAADVFALTSCETWGLAVNEAVASGLPLAVSPGAGSARDLVQDGVTGFRLDIGRPTQMVDALERLADPALRAAMRPALRSLAEAYTLDAAADGILAAAALAIRNRRGG